MSNAPFDQILTAKNEWAHEVTAWLHVNMPYYEGHFQNLAQARGYDDIAATWKTVGRPFERRHIEKRALDELLRVPLQRLAEITGWL